MKDHGATGATGCLKNIAYGSFSNVARTHHNGRSHTKTFVGTLASVEPLRSRTVLQIMDGLRGGLARRALRAHAEIRLLSRSRSSSAPIRWPSTACSSTSSTTSARPRARSRSRTARPTLPEGGRPAGARRGPQRQHHHPRARPRGVRRRRWAWAWRTRPGSRCRTSRYEPARSGWPLCRASTGREGRESAPALKAAGVSPALRAPRGADAWREAGFSVVAPGRRRSSPRGKRCPRPASRVRADRGLRYAQPLGRTRTAGASSARPRGQYALRAARGQGRAGGGGGVRLRRGRRPEDRSRGPAGRWAGCWPSCRSCPPADLPESPTSAWWTTARPRSAR